MNKDEKNVVGTKQGIFDILYLCDYKYKDGHKLYHVRCSKCGLEIDTRLEYINKLSKECHHVNNFNRSIYIKNRITWENKRLKRIFYSMIGRCYNPNNKDYKFYGNNGIEVYEEWINNPHLFEIWALNNGYADGLTIDRIDSSKNYSPENCRWITLMDNGKYKSTTTLLEVNGEIHTGRDWAKICNLGICTINTMLRKYPIEKVQEFIKARLLDMSKERHGKQTWFYTYGIE